MIHADFNRIGRCGNTFLVANSCPYWTNPRAYCNKVFAEGCFDIRCFVRRAYNPAHAGFFAQPGQIQHGIGNFIFIAYFGNACFVKALFVFIFENLGKNIDESTQAAFTYYTEQAEKESKAAISLGNLQTERKNALKNKWDATEEKLAADEIIRSEDIESLTVEQFNTIKQAYSNLVEGTHYEYNSDGTITGKPIWFIRYGETYLNQGIPDAMPL